MLDMHSEVSMLKCRAVVALMKVNVKMLSCK